MTTVPPPLDGLDTSVVIRLAQSLMPTGTLVGAELGAAQINVTKIDRALREVIKIAEATLVELHGGTVPDGLVLGDTRISRFTNEAIAAGATLKAQIAAYTVDSDTLR